MKVPPRRKELWQFSLAGRTRWPVSEGEADRPIEQVSSVEEQVATADEQPGPVASFVGVVVLDCLHNPLVLHLDFASTRDDAGCVVVVDHVDDVIARQAGSSRQVLPIAR